MPTSIAVLGELCRALEATPSRKQKTELLARFLRQLEPEEIEPAVQMLLGRLIPDIEPGSLDVGYSTIKKALSTGQRRLFADEQVSIGEVYSTLLKVRDAQGSGSRRNKENLLSGLLTRIADPAREYLIRSLFGEMRIGVSEGVLVEGIAMAASAEVEKVRYANMLSGDLASVAFRVLTKGEEALEQVSIRLFVPLKPMLADVASSTEEAIDILGEAAFEYKLDGARIQIHKDGEQVRIYSRQLTEVTQSIPEIADIVLRKVHSSRAVLEGEVIAFRDRPLPFQEVMRRFTRVHGVAEGVSEVPLRLYLFDALMKDDQVLIDLAYTQRWAALEQMVEEELLVPRLVTKNPEIAAMFFEKALAEGHEGLMAKRLDSPYIIGKRGKRWLKIKRALSLDLVILAADWGYGRRTGWLSDYYLGAVTGDKFEIIGKTFKGLTDQEFKAMTERLQQLKVSESRRTVKVRPEVVVEVAFDELQKSPRYPAGVALRFARITRIRDDKLPNEADTIETVKRLYAEQFRSGKADTDDLV